MQENGKKRRMLYVHVVSSGLIVSPRLIDYRIRTVKYLVEN